MKSSGAAIAANPSLEDPRRAGAWAALVYALCTFALAYPALSGGFLVNPHSDQFIGGFPVREFAAASLKAGHGIPQWNPYLFGGLPYIAAMHGDIFYPTFILRALLPTDVALTWSFIIHLFLAGCFTYLFLRGWGVRFYGALVGGLAYMLSGPIASYASPGHDGKLYVSALLPLVLWFLIRAVRDGRAWAWGGLAISVGLAVLSPHPQLLQYLLLVSGAFALYLAFSEVFTQFIFSNNRHRLFFFFPHTDPVYHCRDDGFRERSSHPLHCWVLFIEERSRILREFE